MSTPGPPAGPAREEAPPPSEAGPDYSDIEGIVVVPGEDMTPATPLPVGSKNGWNALIEAYVSSISQKCKQYRALHEQSYLFNDKRDKSFTIFLFVMSAIQTIIQIFQTNINSVFLRYGALIFSAIVTALAAINRFLKFQENGTRHRLGSTKFLGLHRSISEQFLFPENERANGKKYVVWAGKTFDAIVNSVPQPPEKVKKTIMLNVTPDADVSPSAPIAPGEVPTEIESVNPQTPAAEQNGTTGEAIELTPRQRYQLGRARLQLTSFEGEYDV